MYSRSPNVSRQNFIEKFPWNFFFQIFAAIKMTRNKNRLFGRYFETEKYIYIFS